LSGRNDFKYLFFIKRLGLRDEKAFGLDKHDVVIENIPFVYNPVQKQELIRIPNKKKR